MKISDRSVCPDIERFDQPCVSSSEEMLLFADIETTGLKKEYCRIYLIGCAYLDIDGWHIRQWLTESASDERAVLEAFAGFASGFGTVVTFNGEGFDLPVIDFKNRYYGIDFDIRGMGSLDIYKEIKPLKKIFALKSLRQKAVEELLGLKREDRFDGGRLIPYYYEYEMTGSPETERLLLLHNFEDVLGMIKIMPVLNYTGIPRGDFEFLGMSFAGTEKFRTEFILNKGVPAPLKNGKISVREKILSVDYDIEDGKVLFPLKGPENYYYLPLEDKVIHKDLAVFVDKKYRQKAAKENCFLKVETERLSAVDRSEFKTYAMNAISSY